ncbi:transcriptional regulator [Metakosakonia massiliensis]|uniref:Inhibitor of hydrogen peroxide resistance n=1 Tax=Phytobacter massiliensis TaxID=1485952 RepID=A0A6N3ABF0_9ENTR|nr:helix-turn-helix domain-containing protein [Phytobacter massiliensis]
MLPIEKPLAEFELLDKCFSPHGVHFELPANTVLTFSNIDPSNVTVVLNQGEIAISRKYNDVLMGIVNAPFVNGLSTSIIKRPTEYIYTTQNSCSGYYLPAELSLKLVEEHQLWRESFCWLTWWYRLAETRDCQLIGSSTYDQIRSTLLIMAEWEETLRARVGVIQYIQKRTGISRSVIAEMLSALRQGNYIEMSKGKLTKINRLPYEY